MSAVKKQLAPTDEAKHVADRITAARTQLILRQPFFGALLLRLKMVPATHFAQRLPNGQTAITPLPTAATDSVHIFYNPAFIVTLKPSEIRGLLCHEVLHVAAGHCWRQGGREHKRWNEACDYAINPLITALGKQSITLPAGDLSDVAYAGMSSEEIYPRLQNEKGKGKGKGNGTEENGLGLGGVLPAPGDEGECAQSEVAWQVATRQAAQAAEAMGSLPADLERWIGEELAPKINWRAELWRFAQQSAATDYEWRRPSHRYLARGLYLPSLREDAMPPIVVMVDTSGSIGAEMLTRFGSEISAIATHCKPERVYVGYVDAKVHAVDIFERGEPVELKPRGGGGTDFRPAFDWVAEEGVEPACLVYLTDTRGTFPDAAPEYPVLWTSTERNATVPWGELLTIEEDA